MKFAPNVGDVNVIGSIGFITRSAVNVGIFDAGVTANGYSSVQQDKLDPQLRFAAPVVPAGLNNGDAVLADIVQVNGVPYATNIRKYS